MNATSTGKVIVGMSGGVDSSVAAHCLLEQGWQVEGLFMKNWDEDDGTEYCTAKADLADAQAVGDALGIRLHTANFAAEYWDSVFEHFLAEYRAGRTPNPDILCNREIKFRAFLDYALALGAHAIATGHYARLAHDGGHTRLLRGRDPGKDQSYFLHAVSGEQLSHALFPIGELHKAEVRRIAARLGLVTHDKKDSTGICFIGERRFKDFLQQYLPAQPGEIRTPEGRLLGRHDGLMYYTLGQRQGLHIGGVHGAAEAPWYVAEKRLDSNTLIVVQGNAHPLLYSRRLWLEKPDATRTAWWVDGHGPALPCRATAKTRYRQTDQPCLLEADGNAVRVTFDTPQWAVTPGQSAVFYDGDSCLGGGVIERTEPHA